MSLWSCRGWVQGLWHAGCFWAGGCSKAELSLPSPSPARQIPTMFWKEMLGPSGYALWGDEAAIYVGLVAFLLCSCYSFLSDKRTDSICWATALISEASGVTQIYFGLSEGGMWPRETRDRKIWRWESYGTCSENIPGFQAGWALSTALSRLLGNDKRFGASSLCHGRAFHILISLIWMYFPCFHLTLFNSVTCYVRFSEVCVFFHMLHQ